MKTLTFWQNRFSIHQAPLLREIAEIWPGTVYLKVDNDISSERRRQGWEMPDYGNVVANVVQNHSECERHFEKTSSEDHIHVFSGITSYPKVYAAFRIGTKTNARLSILSEAGREELNIKGFLRRYKYRLEALRFNSRIDKVLAIGSNGVDWFLQAGYSPEKIYKFGYFVKSADRVLYQQTSRSKEDSKLRLIFIGELSNRKALDVLLNALVGLDATLTVVGGGPDLTSLQRLAKQLSLEKNINWCGNIPNSKIPELLSTHDYLVLPSRFDGWGAVVNEALTVGTPVIVSDSCGASDLIRNSFLGDVVLTDDIANLRRAIEKRIAEGTISVTRRAKIIDWAEQSISPRVAARYFYDIFHAPQHGQISLRAPWEV